EIKKTQNSASKRNRARVNISHQTRRIRDERQFHDCRLSLLRSFVSSKLDLMHVLFHSFANYAARISMKLLFGCVARVRVIGRQNANRHSGFLLAANHISHFDPFIISSVVRRKFDWMAMEEFFLLPVIVFLLRAVTWLTPYR